MNFCSGWNAKPAASYSEGRFPALGDPSVLEEWVFTSVPLPFHFTVFCFFFPTARKTLLQVTKDSAVWVDRAGLQTCTRLLCSPAQATLEHLFAREVRLRCQCYLLGLAGKSRFARCYYTAVQCTLQSFRINYREVFNLNSFSEYCGKTQGLGDRTIPVFYLRGSKTQRCLADAGGLSADL